MDILFWALGAVGDAQWSSQEWAHWRVHVSVRADGAGWQALGLS